MSQAKVKKQQNMQRKEGFPQCLVFFFQLQLVILTRVPNRPQAM